MDAPQLMEDIIQKSLTTANFTSGGTLNPAQQRRFVNLIKEHSDLLPRARFVRMKQGTVEVDKMWLTEPIAEPIGEDTDTPNLARAKFNQFTLQARKFKAQFRTSTETLQENIEGDQFESTVMDAMGRKFADDMETVGIQGDVTIAGPSPEERLLSALNGYDVLTDGSHIVDAGGLSIQKGLFSQMKRRLPLQYSRDRSLAWFVSPGIATDWMDLISDRGTAAGDDALRGSVRGPLGMPMFEIARIPDQLPIAVTAATAAQVRGTEIGPFEITTGVNDTLVLTIDGVGPTVVTLPGGTIETTLVAQAINATFPGTARDDREGHILITSAGTGVAVTIVIGAASTALAVLGLAAGTTAGSDAGTAGTLNEGSFIMLTSPANFVWGMLDGMRVFSAFNPDFDRIQTTLFAQIAFAIENIDSVVKAINVRRRDLF